MDKKQIAHELALLVVEARIRDFKSEHGDVGIDNYSDQAVEDYKLAFNRIEEQL